MPRKEKSTQGINSNEVDRLLKQLDLVKRLAESNYWLTTEELCLLLGFDEVFLQSLNAQKDHYNFAWRNFMVMQMERQNNLSMWAIAEQSQKPDQKPDQTTSQVLTAPKTLYKLKAESDEGEVFPSVYVAIEDFLSPQELARFLQFTQEQEANFIPATIYTKDVDYRRTKVLHEFPEFSQLIVNRAIAIAPQILPHLNIQNFSPSRIESQLTMNNDGNYYKIHNDNGSPDTANRIWTFVYYFYREPKGFTGGELLLYDSKIENNFYVAAKSYKTIQPKNNSIVFFQSRCLHEVLPVSCPSKKFLDSRFAVTCWVRN
jgi:Rps23 Pro-64 3,4-dihydroxylase Tpa1-like proline 4-hydroxylase